jgi:methyl-accepting chemotaxis protein
MTFGKKIAAGFAVCSLLFVAIGYVAWGAITKLTQNSYDVTHSHTVIEHITTLLSALKDAETGQRGFVITGDESYLEPYNPAPAEVDKVSDELRGLVADSASQIHRIDEMKRLAALKLAELKHTIGMRRSQGFEATEKYIQGNVGKSYMDDFRRVSAEMENEERSLLKRRADEVESAQQAGRVTIALGTGLCLLVVIITALVLSRQLGSQIGSAVQHVQSSSTELQAAANQQASGAKESSTAMTEITTTISELLATSRQIAESAQRVSQVAQETASASTAGDASAQKAHESLGGIKRQVEIIVNHMLDLGRKSQQIGGILELINELSEQTNILAINATIEAAGAGDAGKRFAVVADEIRKLADRVGGSTKEIRALIEEIRAAVNTTVMVTEGGSKAVELGGRQFGEVTTHLQQIAGLVTTTAQAAREIQLSTKQQASAVEQVNLAISNVAKATKETETSSNQTLLTATQLSGLSRDLSRLVQPQGARA